VSGDGDSYFPSISAEDPFAPVTPVATNLVAGGRNGAARPLVHVQGGRVVAYRAIRVPLSPDIPRAAVTGGL